MSTTVVILGAGFGGLSAALELAVLKRTMPSKSLNVILVDRNDYQLFTPDLYEIASASREIESEDDLRNTVCLNVRAVLQKKQISFVQADVVDVNREKRVVKTTKKDIHYDYVVVALGSEAFHFGIPGMDKHSLDLKTVTEATAIRSSINELMESRENVHVIVCGGGPAGVELAAEMRVACKNSTSGACPAITIVEGQPTILAPFPQKVQKKVQRRLHKLGISLKTNFFIAEAKNGEVISKEGESLKGDLIVWTGGVKATNVLKTFELALTKRGQLPVQPTLQSAQDERVFAVGDSAEININDEFCPMTAHEAVEQGPIAAKNIVRAVLGQPLKQYKMKKVGYVITMGGKHGIVSFRDKLILTGSIGWAARKWVDFRHFRSILPFMHACSVWYKGLKMMSKND